MANPKKAKAPVKKVTLPKKEVVKSKVKAPAKVIKPVVDTKPIPLENPITKLMLELAGLKTLNTPQAKVLIEKILTEILAR